MKIYEFLERFLTDFNEKEIDFTINEIGLLFRIKVESQKFYEKHFPEALQNFADKICEKQRENCAENTIIEKFKYETLLTEKINHIKEVIKNAEQPKIEEL